MHDDLLRRLRAGHDPEAWARLFEIDQAGIYHFMRRRLNHRQDAEDATQEVFRRVLRSLSSLRDPRGYRGWLYQIALRVAQSQIQTRIGDRHRVDVLARTAPASGTSAMDHSESEDRRARVKEAVDALEEELRTVVLLRYEQGLSYEEIAEATQRPIGTVSKRLHSAHQKLQQALAAVGVSLVAGALEVKAFEAVPGPLAGRLKEMALGAPARRAVPSMARAGGITAACLLAALFVAVPLIRTMKAARTEPLPVARNESAPRPKPSASPLPAPPPPAAATAPSDKGEQVAAKPGILRGIVRDQESREALAGASVWLHPRKSSTEEQRITETTTGADGTFCLEAPAGEYTVDAMAAGHVRHWFERIMESYRIRDESGEPEENEAAAQAIRDTVRIRLEAGVESTHSLDLVPAIELRGTVVDSKGRPVPAAQVQLASLGVRYRRFLNGDLVSESGFTTKYEPDGRTSTFLADLQGRFSISNVYPNGDLTLAASAKGYQDREQVVTLNRRDVEVTMVLERGSTYAGRVLSADGQGIPDACINFLGATERVESNPFSLGKESRPLTAGKGGEFEAADLPPEMRFVAVFAPGYVPRLVDLSSLDPGRIQVLLSRSERAVATGLIVDESGRPVEGLNVVVHRYEVSTAGRRAHLVYTERSGGGASTTAPGEYTIFLPYAWEAPKTASLADGSFRLGDLALAPGSQAFLEIQRPGYERVDIEATATAPLRIQLRPKKE